MSLLSLPAGRRAAVAAASAGLFTTLSAWVMREWSLSRARRAMAALDEATLHDIGVTRGEIEAAVRYGRRALRR